MVAGWEPEAAPNIENRDDLPMEIDHPQGNYRGSRKGRYGNHRKDTIHRDQGKGIALALDEEDDKLKSAVLPHGSTSARAQTPKGRRPGPTIRCLLALLRDGLDMVNLQPSCGVRTEVRE